MQDDVKLSDLKPGCRIELHPGTDQWMMGDRFGQVVSIKPDIAIVKMDVSKRRLKVKPEHIGKVVR